MVIATAPEPPCDMQNGGIKSRLPNSRVLSIMGLGQSRGSNSKDEDLNRHLGEEGLGSL